MLLDLFGVSGGSDRARLAVVMACGTRKGGKPEFGKYFEVAREKAG